MGSVISEISDEKKGEKRERLIELLASGSTLEDAAETVGVTSRTVRNWRDADPEFAELVADAMCHIDDRVERVTLKNCLDPDPAHNSLRMFWLKSRRPEVYRETVKQDITTGGKPLSVQIYLPDNGRNADQAQLEAPRDVPQ